MCVLVPQDMTEENKVQEHSQIVITGMLNLQTPKREHVVQQHDMKIQNIDMSIHHRVIMKNGWFKMKSCQDIFLHNSSFEFLGQPKTVGEL